jgi:hypothetical protein
MQNIKFAIEIALIWGKHKRKKKCHSKVRSQFPGFQTHSEQMSKKTSVARVQFCNWFFKGA